MAENSINNSILSRSLSQLVHSASTELQTQMRFGPGDKNSIYTKQVCHLRNNEICTCSAFVCSLKYTAGLKRITSLCDGLNAYFMCAETAGILLVVPLPELYRSWIGGDEYGTSEERAERRVEEGSDERLYQEHGRV